MTDQYRLIVQAHLLEAVRPGLAGVWAAHHADDEGDLGVPVLGVGQGAGLHDVPVTLGSSVLALELVAAINLRSLTGRSGQRFQDQRSPFTSANPYGLKLTLTSEPRASYIGPNCFEMNLVLSGQRLS